MALYRVKARWSGFTGAPGYTVMHFDAAVEANPTGAANAVQAVHAFFDTFKTLLPSVVRINVENTVEIIDQTTGDLIDALSTPSLQVISGSASGSYAAPVGAAITWTTGRVRNGRRVRGRTFLVPLSAANYETDGTLATSTLTMLTNASQALIDHASDFHVFMRPSGPGASDGASATVTGQRITDKAAVLRSRRD